MSDERDWVLDQLASVVDGVATDYSIKHPDGTRADVIIKRVDRDNSRIYEGSQSVDMTTPIQGRAGKLKSGIFIGAETADVSQSPIGTGYDLDVERVVSLRVEGLTHAEFGHVDPDGDEGVPWSELKTRIRSALYDGRGFPDVQRPNTAYTHHILTNEADNSDEYGDFYDWRVDVAFDGFESL